MVDVQSGGKKRETGLRVLKVSSIPAFLFLTWKLLQFINKLLLLCRGNLCPEMDMDLNIIFQGPLIFHWTCDKVVCFRGISVKIVSSQLAEESGSLPYSCRDHTTSVHRDTNTHLSMQTSRCELLWHAKAVPPCSVVSSGSLFTDVSLLMVRLHLG